MFIVYRCCMDHIHDDEDYRIREWDTEAQNLGIVTDIGVGSMERKHTVDTIKCEDVNEVGVGVEG